MLPLFAGVIVSTTKIMPLVGLSTGWFWQNIVGRLLLGGVPAWTCCIASAPTKRRAATWTRWSA
ncbi:hypothetical protein NMB32_21055 [Stenotrophomonas sp. CD2]|nr:hypothetical protein NMB32_21055 [Stenotrophomonas sp. CD2]